MLVVLIRALENSFDLILLVCVGVDWSDREEKPFTFTTWHNMIISIDRLFELIDFILIS